MEKRWKYNKHILQVGNESFTLLVFSFNGGMEKEANKCYSRIAEKLAEKRDKLYSVMMSWIWRKIVFSMMKSVVVCICGSRSIKHEWEKQRREISKLQWSSMQHNTINNTKNMLIQPHSQGILPFWYEICNFCRLIPHQKHVVNMKSSLM